MDGESIFVDAGDLLERSSYDEPEHWSELFRSERYDLDDPAFIEECARGPYGYRLVFLTKGYFALVSPTIYEFVVAHPDGYPKRWRANVQYDDRGNICRVYAIRNGLPRYGEPKAVYMHREIAGASGPTVFVDHKNGWSLDNRGTDDYPVNLRCVSHAENAVNYPRQRGVHAGLPVGVEPLPSGKFIGRHVRTIEGRRKKLMSGPFDTAEEAAAWYQAKLSELFHHRMWAMEPTEVNRPDFPPLLDSELSERSWQLRQRVRTPEVELAIPF